VTGTSHIRVNKGCDDNGGCIVVPTRDGEVLIAVVSDGAGSAEYSAIGSRIVVRRFLRCASTFVRSGMLLEQLTEQSVSDWLDDIRDHIGVRAIGVGASPRSFAATLVGAIVTRDRAVIIHIGDGAAVLFAYDEDRRIVACARTRRALLWRCVMVRRLADRRACRPGAGASIPRAAVRADAMREDRQYGRGRRRAMPWDRCR
jgi:serine/threonine protein phosphatase PrpC